LIATVIKSIVLAAFLLFAMWAGSLWVYDSAKMNDALQWRWAEIHQEPLYAWHFDSREEITYGHGVSRFHWANGTVSGDFGDPYFYVNLEGRYIDADRFVVMGIRLWSDDENDLRLFHHQKNSDQIHVGELIPVAPGWQTLTLSLPALGWKSKSLADPSAPDADSSWGGESGEVSALRVDPVENGAFEVDWIELYDPETRPRVVDEVEPFHSLEDELFERMRQEPGRTWHIAHDDWLRTPETSHRLRERIAERFPSAIVFPHMPREEELEYPPLRAGGTSAFIPASIFFAALLFLVVRDQVPSPWRALIAVFALFIMVEAYIYWMPSLPTIWRVLMAIPVLGAMWELVPKSRPDYLVGDWRAWIWVSPILLLSVLVLIFTPQNGMEYYSAVKSLGTYFLWALFQQFIIAVLILSRLREIMGRPGVIMSAAFFGFFHFPNFALMAVTFLLGIFTLRIYERYQNLLAISVAHAFLSVGFNTLALHFFWLSRTIGPQFSAAL
jgi:hypothetical protein